MSFQFQIGYEIHRLINFLDVFVEKQIDILSIKLSEIGLSVLFARIRHLIE